METAAAPAVRALVVDFYDSYTYNLVDLIYQVNGVRPKVVFCDDAALDALLPDSDSDGHGAVLCDEAGQGFDSVVLSPGPGAPDDVERYGR